MNCLFNIDERARQKDQKWFAIHPFRLHRIRKSSKHEINSFVENGEQVEAFIIRQIEPGFRRRKPINFSVPLSEALDLKKNPLAYGRGDPQKDKIVDQALSLAFDNEILGFHWSHDLLKEASSMINLGGAVR